ncbi:MAG TPA: serine hydrolase [Steroidobacteraceae bacterium]|nr:serine hydrolase [Steroidobacteraceae bacterium]
MNAAEEFADAHATDPRVLCWMRGSPPPVDKLIRYEDGSFYRFPQTRWSFSHWRQFWPTVGVARGAGPVRALAVDERADLDGVRFVPMGGGESLTWAASLHANYTDGIVVLHRGRIIYERYFGELTPEKLHVCFSVTKSVFGTLAAMLIAEGTIERERHIAHYIPELGGSGFGDATVEQVLDMTTAIDFTENYTGTAPATMKAYSRAIGFASRGAGGPPKSIYSFLASVAKQGTHGDAFTYRTPNTDVVGWLIARVMGRSPAEVLSERIWSRMGVDADGCLVVDDDGTPQVGLSLNCRLRDLARFGELIRVGGRVDGDEIIAARVIEDIRGGGSREAFEKSSYVHLKGWSYRNQWWVSHDDHGSFMARGIHGQVIYIDPAAEMVIARFASHPLASNTHLDPKSLPAYRAIADHLMR